MIHDPLSIDTALSILNEAMLLDPIAVRALIETRVPCNEALADHPTIQVHDPEDGSGPSVGFLGILNGIFGTYDGGPKGGWGPISARFEDHGHGPLVGFERTVSNPVIP